MAETANSSAESIDSVMGAIRRMVRRETKARFSDIDSTGAVTPSRATDLLESRRVEPQVSSRPKYIYRAPKNPGNLPTKILVLQPHMRVDIPRDSYHGFYQSKRRNDAEKLRDVGVEPEMLRNVVREVLEEQLRGELGRQIVLSVKKDLVKLLS